MLSIFGKKSKIYTLIIAALLLMIFTSSCRRINIRSTNVIIGHEIAKTGFWSRPAWSTHSDKLAFVKVDDAGREGRIFIYYAERPSKPRLLKTIPIENGLGKNLTNLRWSRDDKRLLADVVVDFPHMGNIALTIDIDTGKQTRSRVSAASVRSAAPPPRKLKSIKALKFVDDRGKILRPSTVSISPNGKLVAFNAGPKDWRIYLAELP